MQFDINRLRQSHQIIAGSAIALFILMMFKWFSYSIEAKILGRTINSHGPSGSLSGWSALTNVRWILLLTVIVALGAVFVAATEQRLQLPVALSTIVTGLAGLSALLILLRTVISKPHGGLATSTFGGGSVSLHVGTKIWAYLAFLAALGIVYGGWRAMKDEGATFADAGAAARGAASGATAPAAGQAPPAAAPGTQPPPPYPGAQPPVAPPPPPPASPPPAASPPAAPSPPAQAPPSGSPPPPAAPAPPAPPAPPPPAPPQRAPTAPGQLPGSGLLGGGGQAPPPEQQPPRQ